MVSGHLGARLVWIARRLGSLSVFELVRFLGSIKCFAFYLPPRSILRQASS